MKTDILNGVESVEFAPIVNGVPDGTKWLKMQNLEDNSVSITSNKDTTTNIIPEDKDTAILVLYTPGAPDVFNFALLEISAVNLQAYFNASYNPATSSITVFAKKNYANLAMRLTSRPQEGFKMRITYSNTTTTPSFKNNISKNALLVIAVEATILPYVDVVSGKDAVWFIEKLNADGTAFDSTAPTVNAGIDQTVAIATAALVGTASAAGGRSIAYQLWTVKSVPAMAAQPTFDAVGALSTTVRGLVTGVYVLTLTATDTAGISSSDDIQITHS